MIRHATSFVRTTGIYRGDAFLTGLQRHGFQIESKWRAAPRPGDVLLLWNRTRSYEHAAQLYEAAGAHVLIAENAYLPDRSGQKLYTLVRGHHAGAGEWPIGDRPRLEFDLKPWRSAGDHVLILMQRGIGEAGIAMPSGWLDGIRQRLSAVTDRPVRLRRHPGANKTDPWPDLAGAHCAVTWASGSGVKAIAHGIPVFHEFQRWIGAPAARFGVDDIERCTTVDRTPMLTQLSWCQWTLAEIESGEAFAGLI